jgi:hypothetical protein
MGQICTVHSIPSPARPSTRAFTSHADRWGHYSSLPSYLFCPRKRVGRGVLQVGPLASSAPILLQPCASTPQPNPPSSPRNLGSRFRFPTNRLYKNRAPRPLLLTPCLPVALGEIREMRGRPPHGMATVPRR